MAGIPSGIKRIATSVQIRGLAYLQPHPPRPQPPAEPNPDDPPPPPMEGPAVIVHGLTCDIPGVPHHFITLLEAAQEISVGRMGALNAQIEMLVGTCVIRCRNADFSEITDPLESRGGKPVKFPITLAAGKNNLFPIASFPKDPAKVLYIQSPETVAILLVTKGASHHGGPALDPYSGGCTVMCSSGCPQGLLFGGDPT